MSFAWTPPNSLGGVGSIALTSKPSDPLSPVAYRNALAARIDRMVAQEEPERAIKLLEVAADREGLIVGSNLASAGDLLVENSDWLREKADMPTFPVPSEELHHEPTTLEDIEEWDDLEEFLGAIYGV